MGKYNKGILGAFSGKVGTVIGSVWRGIDYLRSLPSIRGSRVFSEGQLEQQARFKLMTGFLTPLKPVLEEGFKNYARGMTGYNSALSFNLKNAVSGVYPDLEIAYPMVLISRGDLPNGADASIAADNPASVTFSWTDNSGQGKALATDKLMVLAVCPELSDATFSIGEAERSDGSFTLALPATYTGKEVNTYIAFTSANGKEVAQSTYTGSVTIS